MKIPLTLIVVLSLFTSVSSAELLVYEGFDYGGTDDADLGGMSADGGTGWSTTGKSQWTGGSNGSAQDAGYLALGLSYDSPTGFDIAGVGGTLNLENNATGPVKIGRDLATPISDITVGGSKTVWMSFLYQHNDSVQGQAYAALLPNNSDVNQWQNGLFYGHHWTEERIVNRPYGFANGTNSTGLLNQGATFFVLARMDFSDAMSSGVVDSVTSTMWVYESGIHNLPIAAPTGGMVAGGTDATRGSDVLLEDFWFFQSGANVGDHSFDELRIGSSFGVVVPEPSSAGLLVGFGAMAFAMIRRR